MVLDVATLEAVFLVAMGGWLIVLGGAFLLGRRTVDHVSAVLLALAGVYAILWQQPALLGVGEALHVAIAQPVFLFLLSGAIFLWTYWLFQRHVEDLEVSLEERQEALSLERTLVDVLSHDLKNPITSARLDLETLVREHPSLENELGPIQDDLRTATEAMTDGLVFSRLSSASEEPTTEQLDLAELAEEAVASRRSIAEERGIEIKLDAPDTVPCGGSPLLKRAFENLVDNAVKFSPEGGTVEVRLEDRGSQAVFGVVDEGPGIPDEERSRLFDRFEKGVDSHGSGLGLAIVQRLVALHSGEIEIDETPDAGTSIQIRLPRTVSGSSSPASATDAPEHATGREVLG